VHIFLKKWIDLHQT